ncbi:protein LPA3 isoform X2 [Telopea speciosissima]|uniref:protein LPA3 isoform X2 n=1 Tax=Telopea speciosissima TaxID=54955 RepID=UPI001CC762EC|nr:protein LPA3 isoform X2 [Telopea speciosissima]
MPLSNTSTVSRLQIAIASVANHKVPILSSFKTMKFGNGRCLKISAAKTCKNHNFLIRSLVGDSSDPVRVDVPFPSDYSDLLLQAKKATELALEDDKQLMEIEFPTAGLESVPGDGEGGTEMTESMLLIRQFCDCFIKPEKASRTRIFFPEASEVEFARKSAFGGASFKLDYLTKPSIFEDFGFVSKVKMADRVKPEDELFLVAYPYFNVNEMLVVEELYREAVENTARKLIVFNGEIDRIRSGYYPPFFYPKLAGLAKNFLPKMETVYYIHNFKGRNGGKLFRCYPGPWKVMKKVNNTYVCLHEQEAMPSLKEVALEILPSA